MLLLVSIWLCSSGNKHVYSQTESDRPVLTSSTGTKNVALKRIVRQAFAETHDGYSSDEVILNDELNTKFVKACLQIRPDAKVSDFNWTLLNLRKAGQLTGIKTTKRVSRSTQSVTPVAEIAARQVQDIQKTSIDRIMVDPELRREFEQIALKLSPDVDLYLVRKAAFQLRKTRKLKPELITRIADWGRVISEHSIASVRANFDLIPEQPGIYIFRDKTGYLYIGQSVDLRSRMKSHLDESSSEGLAKYLIKKNAREISIEIHAFPKDSRAKETRVRRAYESELIRNRKPRFNIQP